jgi:hypothetical protein
MAFPTNILQQVQTYQRSSLGYLQNLCCFLSNANKKFKDFEKIVDNLGSVVTFDLPPRATTVQGLVASFQPAVQRLQSLAVTQSSNSSFTVTNQERIFNVDKTSQSYMVEFGKAFTQELAASIEIDIAKNATSHVMDQQTGQLQTNSGPYRFFGNGITPIDSYQQLQQAVVNFKNYGAVSEGMKVYLPDTKIPAIVGSGLNQFAPMRNNDIAMSWEVGNFGTPRVDYYQSNLLPIHEAGGVGNRQDLLTVVSTNDPTGANITQITFSGVTVANDPEAVLSGDLLQFQDNVGSFKNMRFLTFIGHTVSDQPVQVRATADAAATSGNVTVNIFPALSVAAGGNQNLNQNILAGMQVKFLPRHRAGLIVGGNAFYLAMPTLPPQEPFPSHAEYDKTTGASIRLTYGTLFGQNQMGLIYDAIWGSTLVPEYSMRLAFPV